MDMIDKAAVGERVARARRSAGLTQGALGNAARVDPMTVSRLERGLIAPRTSTFQRLADALGVDVGWLMRGDDDAAAEPQVVFDAEDAYPAFIEFLGTPQAEEADPRHLDELRQRRYSHGIPTLTSYLHALRDLQSLRSLAKGENLAPPPSAHALPGVRKQRIGVPDPDDIALEKARARMRRRDKPTEHLDLSHMDRDEKSKTGVQDKNGNPVDMDEVRRLNRSGRTPKG